MIVSGFNVRPRLQPLAILCTPVLVEYLKSCILEFILYYVFVGIVFVSNTLLS